MTTAKLKLNECLEMHEKCREGLGSIFPLLPTRVIDVGVATNTANPKLYTTQKHERAHYVCLSYVWGGEQPSTTKSNIVALAEEISSESLSQTAQDAIRVTRKLGIRYLWIDALCIIQDDDDDKKRELRVMGNIYKDATLTISASSSIGAASGFAKAEPPQGCELPFYLPDGTMGSVVAVPSQLVIPYFHKPTLHSRGWTFQERMLSRRLLIFVNGELKWQCPSSSLENSYNWESDEWQTTDSEDSFGQAFLQLDFSHQPLACFSAQITNTDGDSFWADTVKEYSSRIFTKPEDRLPAIAGIIQSLENSCGDTCVAGLWRSRLAQDLYWERSTNWRPKLKDEDAGEAEGSYAE
ncbi:HET-domain-containing protein, partial [Stipitochalara longipes BDJ]